MKRNVVSRFLLLWVVGMLLSVQVFAQGLTVKGVVKDNTKHIEGLMDQLKKEVTILIVTHNMSQAMRISDRSMFMYMGELIEYDNTEKMFKDPADERTRAYLTGKMG